MSRIHFEGPIVSACPKTPRREPVAGAMDVGLLTGGVDRPYVMGLAEALLAKGVVLDFVGSDDLDIPALRVNPGLNWLNLRGSQRNDVGFASKVARILVYYARLLRYGWVAKPRVFHILWNNKFEFLDRSVLMLYYKLRGRKVVLTAHNINAAKRDSNDSLLNRLTLRIQYRLADHIFVHTRKMKRELLQDFGVDERAVTVIPFGLNNSVPLTELTVDQARRRLCIQPDEQTILFFGSIGPYKGLEFLVAAFQRLAVRGAGYRLIIAGHPARDGEAYFATIQQAIELDASRERVIRRIAFIPDEETELYFKAADLLVLPYTEVSQSGVLVLGYSFGLPVVAADVGSLRDEVIEGRTGFLCRPSDPDDLAETIERYFQSDLYRDAECRRARIRAYACERYSWGAVSEATCAIYRRLVSAR